MNPLIIAAGVAGVAGAGYLTYKHIKGGQPPAFQSMNSADPTGAPVKVATPVSEQVTTEQAAGVPMGTSMEQPQPGYPPGYPYPPDYSMAYPPGYIIPPQPRRHHRHPVPTTIPGKGVVYAPPGVIHLTRTNNIFQPAPIIITQHGSASIAVGSVKNVQHALNTLGYAKPPLIEDDKLGPKTIAAIKLFQSRNGIVVNGNASAATKAALSAALSHTAGGSSIIGPMIHNSHPETGVVTHPSGAVIHTAPALALGPTDIQHILNVLGASPPLKEDGKVGRKTVAAIKSFQTVHGLTPNGVADANTKTALHLTSTSLAASFKPEFYSQT
jgi:Putative peptidoglycan binding domain